MVICFQLSPSFVAENSQKGQRVGCLQVLDDDPGQTHQIFMVGSAQKYFELFDEGGRKCVKVKASFSSSLSGVEVMGSGFDLCS